MQITLPSGEKIPLGEVATIDITPVLSDITRINGNRSVNIIADIDKDNVDVSPIITDLNRFMHDLMQDHPGISYALVGEQEESRESSNSLLYGVIFSILAIYAFLSLPLQSYTQPIIVASILPFSIIGALVGHMIVGIDLSIMSILGMLALCGVVVNDGLIFVERINKCRKENMPLNEAIMASAVSRFRPILLTSLTTFVGLCPLLLEKSTQAQFLIPMAVSIGFGIIFSAMLNLVIIPVVYHIYNDFSQKVRNYSVSIEFE